MARFVKMVTQHNERQRDDLPEGLHVVHDEPDAIADIIFVHGITGHPFKSWAADSNNAPWIETLLPGAVPRVRVLTFGYHAKAVGDPGSVSQNSLLSHSEDLLNMIGWDKDRKKDKAANNPRPIIFVCHSLGGLLVQQALTYASHTKKHQHILQCILGIAFMGTPMRGSEQSLIHAMVGALGIIKETNTDITEILKSNSRELRNLQKAFRGMLTVERHKAGLEGVNIICFIEQLALAPFGIIVSNESATLDGYSCQTIYRDHRTMVQFSSVLDAGFKGLTSEINDWLEQLTLNLNRRQPMTRETKDTEGVSVIPSGSVGTAISTNTVAGTPSADKSFQTAEVLKKSFRDRLKAYKSKSNSASPHPAPRTSLLHDAIFHYSEAIRLSGIKPSSHALQSFNSNSPWREGEEPISRTYTLSYFGIAECQRELSHRRQFSHKEKIQYLDNGMQCLHKAYQEARSGLMRSTSFAAVDNCNSFPGNRNGKSSNAIIWPDGDDTEHDISDVNSIHTISSTTSLDTIPIARSPSPLTSVVSPGLPSPQETAWSTLLLRIKIERAMLLARQTVIYETEGPGQIQMRALAPVLEGTGTRAEERDISRRGRAGGKSATLEQVSESRNQALCELNMVIEEASAMGKEDFVEYARKGVKSLGC